MQPIRDINAFAAAPPPPGLEPGEALDARVRRLERVLAGTGHGHWDWDLGTGAVWYDLRFRALLGHGASDEFPRTFQALQEHVHPDERARLLQALRRHLEQQIPFEFECRLRLKGGDWRWFRLSGAAERDATGRPVGMAGALADIAEQRRAAENLHRSEEFLRRTLDALTTAVGVLNAQGELVEINRAWREFPSTRGLTGLRFGFGEHYATLCRNAVERCAAGPAVAHGIEQVLWGEREGFVHAYDVRDDEGARFVQVRAQPYEVGGWRGVIITHEDVTGLHAAHEAVARNKEFYGLILDSVPTMIAYVGADGQLSWANRAYEDFLRTPVKSLRGRTLAEMVGPDQYRVMAPRIEAVLTGRTVEFQVRTEEGGEPRELAVTYLPHLANGQVAGFFSVARDITSQRRLEIELRQSQKMEAVGQLTGGIAHDFNNLLAVVIGNLQLLERPLKNDPRLCTQVATALRAALRGADLTRRLLAFSRQQVLEPRVTLANRLVRGMLELLSRSLGPAITLDTQLAADAWPVFVDPGQLENCVLNLAINARDAMPDGGQLTLSTRNRSFTGDAQPPGKLAPGDYLEVEVADTGIGMAPEVAKRAFEPFFTTKEIGKGTGLGLSMVYGFCEQSGGIAVIDSTPGRGTRVRLLFPRSDLAVPKVPEVADVPAAELPHGDEWILLVEDDPDVRETTRTALGTLGYRVLAVEGAAEALRALERAPNVALLMTDVMLPGGLLGPGLASRARDLQPALKVLFTTGYTDTLGRVALTAADVMLKPFAITELARRVRATLDRAAPAAPDK